MLETQDDTPHYRAIMHEQDAVLKAPTGERIAIFTHFEDAVFAADAINTAADNADTLGQVASRLERWLANDELPTPRSATRLLTTVNTAPARMVIKAASAGGEVSANKSIGTAPPAGAPTLSRYQQRLAAKRARRLNPHPLSKRARARRCEMAGIRYQRLLTIDKAEASNG